MKTIICLILLAASPLIADDQGAHASLVNRYVVLMRGHDQALDSGWFEVKPHWKVTCVASKSGPDMDVRIFANPEAGTSNLQVVSMNADGTASCHIREGGRWKLSVQGFDAAWEVRVEEDK